MASPDEGKGMKIEWVLVLILLGLLVVLSVVVGFLFFRFDTRPAQVLQPDPRFVDLVTGR